MKRKDIITIVIAVLVVVFAAAFLYRKFFPPTKDNNVMVTVPHKVEPTFNQAQIDEIKNPALKDYAPDITPNFQPKGRIF